MEGSNYWGHGYKTHHSYPRSRLNHLKKARGEIWPKRSEEETTHKIYLDEDKKSAIDKQKIKLILIFNRYPTFLTIYI